MTINFAARFAGTCILILLSVPVSAAGFTAQQSASGRILYAEHCASCHGPQLEGGAAPALSGNQFAASWSQPTRNVDDMFYILRSSMPRPAVGSLELSEYVDVLAFMLSRNGLDAGPDPLTADAEQLAKITLHSASSDSEPLPPKPIFIAGEGGMTPRGSGPSAEDLRNAASGDDWLYHTQNYRGTRYSPLQQVNTDNVDQLKVACMYQLGSLESFVTGPIEYAGTMYVTTSMEIGRAHV